MELGTERSDKTNQKTNERFSLMCIAGTSTVRCKDMFVESSDILRLARLLRDEKSRYEVFNDSSKDFLGDPKVPKIRAGQEDKVQVRGKAVDFVPKCRIIASKG